MPCGLNVIQPKSHCPLSSHSLWWQRGATEGANRSLKLENHMKLFREVWITCANVRIIRKSTSYRQTAGILCGYSEPPTQTKS